jgi:iron(III) transport system ATP-binding protein
MIVAEALWKSYENAAAILRGVSFRVKRGEIYTLLGPSGCGKTTSLRALAGLETPDCGRITLGDRLVFSAEEAVNLPPDRRRIGMVFQSYAIWPHMTVAGNVAYPLETLRLARKDIERRVALALEVVGLANFHDRPAPSLSGGQQQRVALARAIVAEPELLLLDEPLSNLDAKLRAQMRSELAALQRRLGHTTVYVTHDQEEALALSHRIALMRDGEIVEDGDPVSMYEHPQHPFTAAFLGAANFIDCKVPGRARAGEQIEVDTVFGRFTGIARRGEDREPRLFFRPHHARLVARPPETGPHLGKARVVETQFLGDVREVTLQNGDAVFHMRVSAAEHLAPGQNVSFTIDPRMSIAFVPGI